MMKNLFLFTCIALILFISGCNVQENGTTTSSTVTTTSTTSTKTITICGDGLCTGGEDAQNCPQDCDKKQNQSLEIHEWGVLGGCVHNRNYIVTSRPKQMLYVDLPIIYVHANNIDNLNVTVTFSQGKPTDTYPSTKIDNETNSISWINLEINPGEDEINAVETDQDYRIPLEEMKPTLNNVDADELVSNGEKTRFLFYEGETAFQNQINVTLDVEGGKVAFRNDGNFTAHNVILAHMIGDYMDATTLVAVGGSLAPGEEKTVGLDEKSTENLIKGDMLGLGFTQKEVDAFAQTWDNAFFFPSNTGFTNLIYRLPQYKYEEMLPATFSPQPGKIVRTMYVLVEVSER
ncbi:MAG: hypothetical protein U9M95_03670 [Candidatus Altiarchaeota archaeon]|nr:hypothetical protein [Candidatus Altiarchaeota archaeon]